MNADAIAQLKTWPVYLINLHHRTDRLQDTLQQLERCRWTDLFRWPITLRAYNGWKLPLPDGAGGGMSGAWGCKRSHEEALRLSIEDETIEDETPGVIVLEDDFEVQSDRDFIGEMQRFLTDVPDDFDQLMPGYQAWDSTPEPINPNVVKLVSSNRTQFYAIRDREGVNMRRELFRHLLANVGHTDHLMSAIQKRFNVYAPTVQVCGQRKSFSDIEGRDHDSRHWIMAIPGRPILVLHAPQQVIGQLSHLLNLHSPSVWHPQTVAAALGDLQTRSMTSGRITTIIHADATAGGLKAYTVDPVHSVCGSSVDEIIERLPARVRGLLHL